MTDPLSTYDAVMLASFGGPDRPEDVLPFLRRVTAGKGIPDERLAEVGEHYRLFGGRSPINDQNRALLAALRAELDRRGSRVPVVWGNRNWHPTFAETLQEVEGTRVLALTTSAYPSYSGCRQYAEDLAQARPDRMRIDLIRPYALTPGFVEANADALLAAIGDTDPYVLFVTHSIPLAMARTSGSRRDGSDGGAYVARHRQVMEAVLERVERARGERPASDLAYCSRSGPPQQPWLEPDVNAALAALAEGGVTDVVLAPIGFVSDHMEVIFDLDTEAAGTARRLGVTLRRAATAGTHPAFVSGLVDLVLAAADGATPACPADCCPPLHRGLDTRGMNAPV